MKMTDKVLAELQKQGFLPQREDFGIVFKYQMVNYLYFENKEDDEYFNLYIPYIFEVDKENMADVLTTINAINNAMKVVKLVVNDDHVWACFEEELPKDASLEDVLPYAVATLFHAREQFYEQLKKA